jgi:hypothetical protein
LSSLNVHDPEALHIENLLNTLNIERSIYYKSWFDGYYVLLHIHPIAIKPLAEKFSMKCPEKFNKKEFDEYWERASARKDKVLTIGALYYWAKLDNPEKYEQAMNSSLF